MARPPERSRQMARDTHGDAYRVRRCRFGSRTAADAPRDQGRAQQRHHNINVSSSSSPSNSTAPPRQHALRKPRRQGRQHPLLQLFPHGGDTVVAVVGALARHSGTHQLAPRQAIEKWVLKGPMLTSHVALESKGEPAANSNEASLLSQVLPAIRGAQLVGLLDGTDAAPPTQIEIVPADKTADTAAKMGPNPAYAAWLSRDQLVLAYPLQSLSREVLPHVHRIDNAAGVWHDIEEMFAAQSEAKINNLLGFSDELIAAGHPLTDRQLVSYILAVLGADYNALVAALGVATTPISLSLLFSHLHAYDQRQLMLNGSPQPDFETPANAASRQWRPRSGNYSAGNSNNRSRGDRGDRGDRVDRHDDRRDYRRDDR
ncbi:hypothetical protein QYE76_009251 [Lolium multiflorum]|uniref:Uncharacterized protein n=1 Tax=Lolium multiflorum TaxID=4521 RepID=A0AAD8X3E8_LOLMU|nr:hypothetical protein QYE76_009251 [Lolium multiflorum]